MGKISLPILSLLAFITCGPGLLLPSHAQQSTVKGAEIDRENVFLYISGDGLPEKGMLSDGSGAKVPFQRVGPKQSLAIIPKVAARQNSTWSLTTENVPSEIAMSVRGGVAKIMLNDKPFLTYQGVRSAFPRPDIKKVFERGGYIHPLFSPSGLQITDDFPTNHVHHHGIWTAWTKTEFDGRAPDFWNMGEGKGRVDSVVALESTPGPVVSTVKAVHDHADLTSGMRVSALKENWEIKAYPELKSGGLPIRMFDLTIHQESASDIPLKLPLYHYGGVGFRGNWDWNGATNTFFLTSEGITNRIKGNETRGRWCWIGGLVGGKLTGLVIMNHPSSFRAPQPMRLHPSEPFFCYAPTQMGDFVISKETPYNATYRYVVFDGAPDKDRIESWYREFAEPLTMALGK